MKRLRAQSTPGDACPRRTQQRRGALRGVRYHRRAVAGLQDRYGPCMGREKARKPRKPGKQTPRIVDLPNVSVETKKNVVLNHIMSA